MFAGRRASVGNITVSTTGTVDLLRQSIAGTLNGSPVTIAGGSGFAGGSGLAGEFSLTDDFVQRAGAALGTEISGVTKLERIQFDSKEAQQAATMRKMLVAMATRPARARSSSSPTGCTTCAPSRRCRREKQQRIAQETLDIYAPLAHRLGMQEIKQQLEDLVVRRAVPEALRRARPPRRHPHARARGRTWPRRSPRSAAGCAELEHRRRGHRPGQAPVEHLREDGRQGPRVRRHLRPRRHPRRSSTR